MKPVDKKDLPKLYVLIALAVIIFGFFIYSMTFGSEAPPASAAGNKKKPAKTSAPGAAVASNGSAGAGATEAAASGTPAVFDPRMYGPPQGGRDPFQPVGMVAAAPQLPPPPVSAPVQRVAPIYVPPAAPIQRLRPSGSLGDLLGNAGKAQDASAKPVEMGPPPAPTLAVTGVVLGDPTSGNPRNVAILRANNGEDRRFVSVGDYVGNGYTVVAVHADGVEIQDKAGNRRVTIKLGQPGDNARAN